MTNVAIITARGGRRNGLFRRQESYELEEELIYERFGES